MKLYYAPAVCSLSVHVALHELGIEHDLQKIDLKKGEHQQPEYLKINPRGQVAALETDDGIITENVAILLYLDEMNPGKILPKSGYERAIALQWLLFTNTSLHGAYSKFMMMDKNGADQKLKEVALDNIQSQWDEIERHLNAAGSDFLAGNNITAGDIYTAVVAHWSFIPKMPNLGVKTKALIEKVLDMPAFQAALDDEGVDYKAAA